MDGCSPPPEQSAPWRSALTINPDEPGRVDTRVLVVTDDMPWHRDLVRELDRHGLRSSLASSYADARCRILIDRPDIVLIKAGRPVSDEVIKAESARRDRNSPHLVVFAPHMDALEVGHFLESGADDYFHLSYGNAEIVSRLFAIQRRRLLDAGSMPHVALGRANQPSLRFHFGAWSFDCATVTLTAPTGGQVPLTRGEGIVITKLVVGLGHVQDRAALTTALRGGAVGNYARTTDTMMSRLRRKLAAYASSELIETIPKRGYRIVFPVIHDSYE